MPVLLLLCAVLTAGQQPPTGTSTSGGTSPAPSGPATSTVSPAQDAAPLPVSLDRIQRALSAPAPLELKEQHPVFRLEVFGRKPTLEDILGEKFWLGPAPYGGMTHKEFLDMVTPKEAQPFGGFSGKYLVAETALTLLEQWALKSAIHKFQTAHDDHERDAARKEVLDALAALEKARRDAGLPPSGTSPK